MEAAATQSEAPEGAARTVRGAALRFALATLLLFVAPGPMLVVAIFMTAVAVLAIPVVYGLRREHLKTHLRKAAVRLAFLVMAGTLVAANFHLAEARMRVLVDAVHSYQDAHGAYPATLAELVPEHAARIPRATYWLTMNRFRWNPKHGLLTCIPSPPIGWIGYDFRKNAPTALD